MKAWKRKRERHIVRQNTRRENGQNVRTGRRTENLEDDNKIRDAIWAEDFNEYKSFSRGILNRLKKGNRRPHALGNNGNEIKEHQ